MFPNEDLPFFFMMSSLIFLTAFGLLWILWTATLYLKYLLINGPSTEYMDDNDSDTDQEEMAVYTIESQF